MLPGLAIATLLALVSSALPASAATRQARDCNTVPVFFGLHGITEGPSPTVSKWSEVLMSFDREQNAMGGAVLNYPISYTTLYPNDFFVPGRLRGALADGENALDSAITDYSQGCSVSQDEFFLVGYSMGAWVINKWIVDHPSEWPMIKAVVLYGDPCWVNGKDQGLARQGSHGCMPATYYPFPVKVDTVPFPVQSWSMPRDPVSGAGWGEDRIAQLRAAKDCEKSHCSHLEYADSTEIYEGAKLVVSRLGG